MASLLKSFEDWRYENPLTWRMVIWGIVLSVCIGLFMLLPPAPLLRVIGVTGAQTRLGATANAIYWEARARFGTSDTESPVKIYGNLVGISKDGRMAVSVVEGEAWVERVYAIADTQLTDLVGAAKLISSLVTKNVRIDLYSMDRAVFWIDGVPLNVRFIEMGVARPDPNPPTNIVDAAFATYYWNIATGDDRKGN